MSIVESYGCAIYTDKDGHEGCRARIFLNGSNNKFLGTISFHDPDKPAPSEGLGNNGEIFASAPYYTYGDVVDLLRHGNSIIYEVINGDVRLTCSQTVRESET